MEAACNLSGRAPTEQVQGPEFKSQYQQKQNKRQEGRRKGRKGKEGKEEKREGRGKEGGKKEERKEGRKERKKEVIWESEFLGNRTDLSCSQRAVGGTILET
jgi:hypothetical protein